MKKKDIQNSRNRMWKIEDKKDTKSADIMLYGPIDSSMFWGDEITPTEFKKELDAISDSVQTLNIYINSPGGDVFAGQTIYNMLERHPAKKNTYADGIAASIASIIFMIGEERHIPSNAFLMIHNAQSFAVGNSADLRATADILDKVDGTLVSVYANRTGLSAGEISTMMNAETWMDGNEAFEKGFATHTDAEQKIAASMDGEFLIMNGQQFDKSNFKNMPSIKVDEGMVVIEGQPKDGYKTFKAYKPDSVPEIKTEAPRPAPVDLYKAKIMLNERKMRHA